MTLEPIIVWLLVAAAAFQVVKRLYAMVRGVIAAKSGCSTGCETCEYAPKEEKINTSPISIDLSLISSSAKHSL